MIRLADIFTNGMTLQREKEIRIWGTTDIAQSVEVTLNGRTILEGEKVEGDFTLVLPPLAAEENATLSIKGADIVELTNVDIGEVWVAGGQSNMEFLLRYDKEAIDQISQAHDAHFRFFDVGEYSFPEEKKRSHKDNRGWDKWMQFDPEHAEFFSAVSVYFAKQLRKNLNVPVGIVGCNWGGTTAASWLDERLLAEDPDLNTYLLEYEEATKDLNIEHYEKKHREALDFMESPKMVKAMARVMEGEVTKWEMIKAIPLLATIALKGIPMGPYNQNAPGCLYHSMLSQIIGFSCRGVIWYQGCNDENKASMYDKLLSKMIGCWRRDWDDDMPFLIVQLAPFGSWLGANGENFPEVRAKQEIVCKTVPNCWLASIMDAGDEKDIHPKDKRPVGERLALLARNKVYGENVLSEAPELEELTVKKGEVCLRFANAGDGLEIRGEKLQALDVTVDGVSVQDWTAYADGDEVILSSEKFETGKKIRVKYAWTAYCLVNLYSSAGLAAKPFQKQV